jgi:CheY-specific phosphatase CheX
MAVKFLGQYLLEQGLIDKDQLLRALEIQRECSPMLGELAVQQGMLDAKQAQRINDRQLQEDKRFGDIAIELGLLDAGQIDQLLAAQKAGRKMFGSILIEQGMLSQAQLDQALAEQQAERASAEQGYQQRVAGHPLAREIALAIDSCSKQFTRILKSRAQFSAVLDGANADAGRATACIQVKASTPLSIALSCELPTAHRIACAFMRITPERCDDELACDALGELLNVIMGYVVRDMLADDEPYTPSPPDHQRSLPQIIAGLGSSLAVAMESELGGFELMVGR